MAGYSGTPLARKLGIKPGARVALLHAPARFEDELAPLPEAVVLLTSARAPLEVALLFATQRLDLARRFAQAASALAPAGGLWIAWPKRASGVPTDVTESEVRMIGLASGLVDNKVCAVNDVWSALRFVIRVNDRPAISANGTRTSRAITRP
jgi:hypothetical protein